MGSARDIWSEDLTDAQLRMVMESGTDGHAVMGFGVELRGQQWGTARSLERMGLGSIEGDPCADLPGLYFNNEEGVRVACEFDEEATHEQ